MVDAAVRFSSVSRIVNATFILYFWLLCYVITVDYRLRMSSNLMGGAM